MTQKKAVSGDPSMGGSDRGDEVLLKDKFLMEEYKALRADVLLQKQHQFTIQKWVTVSLGVLYGLAFGVTGDARLPRLPEIDRHLLIFSGFAISLIGAILHSVADYIMRNISQYVTKIEAHFTKGDGPEGWEHFMGRHGHRPPGWGVVRNPFWWGVITVSAALALHEIYRI